MSQLGAADNTPAAEDGFQAEHLVEQAQRGDRQAFHRLVDHYQADIFRMVYFRTRSRMDAEDLTQDVFLRAFKAIRRLQSPKLFRSWLYRIAVNRVRDHYRALRVKSLIGLVSLSSEAYRDSEAASDTFEAPARLEAQAFWDRIRQLLGELSRMEREAFLLRFFDQLSIKEMTAAMGKNENTVKTHLYRALRKVKAAIGDGESLRELIR